MADRHLDGPQQNGSFQVLSLQTRFSDVIQRSQKLLMTLRFC